MGISGSTVTITELHNMTAAVIGSSLAITGASQPANNGLFPITAVLSESSIQITNPAAVPGDGSPCFLIDAALASIAAPTTCALVTGVLNASPSMVGQNITIADTGQAGNSGTFTVIAYVSPTAVWIDNPSAVANDFGTATLSGTSAFISSVVPNTNGGEEVISGLTDITPALVGQAINVSNAFYAGSDPAPNNNGDEAIIGFVSDTSLVILNNPYPGASFAPDYGVGGTSGAPTVNWSIQLNIGIVAVQSGAIISGLTGIATEDVGKVLTVQNGATPDNNGIWGIAGYVSATAVLLNNVNAVADANNGALWWHLGVDYDLSSITLSSTSAEGDDVEFIVYDGVTFNHGIAQIDTLQVFSEFNYQQFLGTFLPGPSTNPPVWRITGNSQFEPDNGGFIYDFSLTANFYPTLVLSGQANVDLWVNFGSNGSVGINVNVSDSASFGNELVEGTQGNVNVQVLTALTDDLPAAISGFGGSYNVNYMSRAETLAPFSDFGLPTPAPNDPIRIGTMYFDHGQSQAFWWNGTTWVSYTNPSFNTTNVYQAHASPQSGNLSAGDHVMFDSSDTVTAGGNINLDASSPYQTAPGPSIGRISLAADHLYKATFDPGQVSGSGNIYFQWVVYNSIFPAGQPMGNGTRMDDGTDAGDFASHGPCVAYIYTNSGSGGAGVIEVRIMFNSGMTGLGENAAAPLYAWFTVEQVY